MSGTVSMWVALAVVAIVLEILTKTFNLMAVALGFCVAALLAWLNFGVVIELIAAIVVAIGFLLWLRRSSMGNDLQEAEESRYSVMSDDGDDVHISQWSSATQTDVVFKGRTWQAQLAPGSTAAKGHFTVREVREGKLILVESGR